MIRSAISASRAVQTQSVTALMSNSGRLRARGCSTTFVADARNCRDRDVSLRFGGRDLELSVESLFEVIDAIEIFATVGR